MSIQIISLKHNNNSGFHIPSLEEAFYEDANEKVQSGKMIMEVPEKTVMHSGQSAELFCLNEYGNNNYGDLLHDYGVELKSLSN